MGDAAIVQLPARKAQLSERFVAKIEGTSPVVPLVACLLWGMALMLLSYALHPLDSFQSGNKNFGWVSELNWSSTFAFFIPLSLFFSSLAITSIPQVITSLAEGKMVRGVGGESIDAATLIGIWRERAKKSARLAGFLAAGGFLISWFMAWHFCFRAGASGAPSWQRAAVLGVPGANRLGVDLLGILAYTSQGAAIACFCYYVLMIFTFAIWIQDYTRFGAGTALYPAISESDARCGFERLEPLINGVLLASVAYFCQFFMTRLFYIYVDHPSASSMFDIVKEALGRDFGRDIKDLVTASGPSFFEYGSAQHFQSTVMGFAMLIVALSAVIVPLILVQSAAGRSEIRLRQMITEEPEIATKWYRVDAERALARLDAMTVWPLRYPRPVGLLLLVILATACFFFYKLLLLVLASIIFEAVVYFSKSLKRQSGDDAPAGGN